MITLKEAINVALNESNDTRFEQELFKLLEHALTPMSSTMTTKKNVFRSGTVMPKVSKLLGKYCEETTLDEVKKEEVWAEIVFSTHYENLKSKKLFSIDFRKKGVDYEYQFMSGVFSQREVIFEDKDAPRTSDQWHSVSYFKIPETTFDLFEALVNSSNLK